MVMEDDLTLGGGHTMQCTRKIIMMILMMLFPTVKRALIVLGTVWQ